MNPLQKNKRRLNSIETHGCNYYANYLGSQNLTDSENAGAPENGNGSSLPSSDLLEQPHILKSRFKRTQDSKNKNTIMV